MTHKDILAEDFVNASNEYTTFCDAMLGRYEDDPIMYCLIGNLNRLANEYYTAMIKIYRAGMTLDEALHLEKGGNDGRM